MSFAVSVIKPLNTNKNVVKFAESKMSTVREDDGSFVLLHRSRAIEAEMDLSFDRWPNEQRWSPKRTGPLHYTFADRFNGQRAVIIGKGPSLDDICRADFETNDVVFCCNDAVHRIVTLCLKNPLYVVQLDEQLRDTCRCKHAHHFISAWAKDWAPEATILRTHWNQKLLTAVEAIILAKHMGCKSFKLLGFDAMNGKLGYAKCIGYTPGKNPQRFLEHKKYVLSAIGDLPYE